MLDNWTFVRQGLVIEAGCAGVQTSRVQHQLQADLVEIRWPRCGNSKEAKAGTLHAKHTFALLPPLSTITLADQSSLSLASESLGGFANHPLSPLALSACRLKAIVVMLPRVVAVFYSCWASGKLALDFIVVLVDNGSGC